MFGSAQPDASGPGCDVVYFAAGYYPRYSTDLDTAVQRAREMARNVWESVAQASVPRLVYTSSTGLLDTPSDRRPADERDLPSTAPQDSVYRAVKWASEHEMQRARDAGLDVVSMMPSACLGPWDVRLGTGGLLVGVLSGKLPWWTEGLVHMVDVGDVARAHVLAGHMKHPADHYIISGHSMYLGDVFRRLIRRFGGAFPTEQLDADAARARADAEEAAAEPKRERVPMPRELVDIITRGHPINADRSRTELGIAYARLNDSLDRAHGWFVEHRYLSASMADPRSGTVLVR